MADTVVFVSVSGGIAETQIYGKAESVEVIEIDWDNYEDNIPDVDTVVWHIGLCKQLEPFYPDIWDDYMLYWLERCGGEDLESFTDEDTVLIMDALEKAGHPWKLTGNRQLPLDLLEEMKA